MIEDADNAKLAEIHDRRIDRLVTLAAGYVAGTLAAPSDKHSPTDAQMIVWATDYAFEQLASIEKAVEGEKNG